MQRTQSEIALLKSLEIIKSDADKIRNKDNKHTQKQELDELTVTLKEQAVAVMQLLADVACNAAPSTSIRDIIMAYIEAECSIIEAEYFVIEAEDAIIEAGYSIQEIIEQKRPHGIYKISKLYIDMIFQPLFMHVLAESFTKEDLLEFMKSHPLYAWSQLKEQYLIDAFKFDTDEFAILFEFVAPINDSTTEYIARLLNNSPTDTDLQENAKHLLSIAARLNGNHLLHIGSTSEELATYIFTDNRVHTALFCNVEPNTLFKLFKKEPFLMPIILSTDAANELNKFSEAQLIELASGSIYIAVRLLNCQSIDLNLRAKVLLPILLTHRELIQIFDTRTLIDMKTFESDKTGSKLPFVYNSSLLECSFFIDDLDEFWHMLAINLKKPYSILLNPPKNLNHIASLLLERVLLKVLAEKEHEKEPPNTILLLNLLNDNEEPDTILLLKLLDKIEDENTILLLKWLAEKVHENTIPHPNTILRVINALDSIKRLGHGVVHDNLKQKTAAVIAKSKDTEIALDGKSFTFFKPCKLPELAELIGDIQHLPKLTKTMLTIYHDSISESAKTLPRKIITQVSTKCLFDPASFAMGTVRLYSPGATDRRQMADSLHYMYINRELTKLITENTLHQSELAKVNDTNASHEIKDLQEKIEKNNSMIEALHKRKEQIDTRRLNMYAQVYTQQFPLMRSKMEFLQEHVGTIPISTNNDVINAEDDSSVLVAITGEITRNNITPGDDNDDYQSDLACTIN